MYEYSSMMLQGPASKITCSCMSEAAPGPVGAVAASIVSSLYNVDPKHRAVDNEDRIPATIHEQVWETATMFESLRQRRELLDGPNAPRSDPPGYLLKDMRSRDAKANDARATLGVWEAPEYREMQALVERARENEEDMPEWQRNICQSLRGLLSQVSLARQGGTADLQMKKVYEWYKMHKTALAKFSKGDDVAQPAADEPQEVCVIAEDGRVPPPWPASNFAPASDDLDGNASALDAASRAQIRDRLKSYHTHAIVGPLTARKLRAAAAADVISGGGTYCIDSRAVSPEPGERSFTPSTATGGLTARSIPSARSTPTPGRTTPFSRPSSAVGYTVARPSRPLTAGAARGPRRHSADGAAQQPSTPTVASTLPQRPKTATGATSSAPVPSVASAVGEPSPRAQSKVVQSRAQSRQASLQSSQAQALQSKALSVTVRPEVPPLALPARLTPRVAARSYNPDYHYGSTPAPERVPTEAEVAMEERFLARRNREVADHMLVEEQRAALQTWASRRARVEEESIRNVEVARFQSELAQRRYSPPADAQEDVQATAFEDQPIASEAEASGRESVAFGSSDDEQEAEQQRQNSRAPSAVSSAAGGRHGAERAAARQHAPAGRPTSAAANAPRIDVSRPGGASRPASARPQGPSTVTFAPGIEPPKGPRPALNDRIAQLRKVNARYLQAYAESEEWDSEEGEGPPPCVFNTDAASKHISLSVYYPQHLAGEQAKDGPQKPQAPRWEDDSDVLAGACDWWRHKHGEQEGKEGAMPLGDGTLDEIRFKQMQEVESIKRVFARRNCPVDAATLEYALVMPEHRFRANVTLFNTMPNILKDPFAKAKKIKKKKKKVKAKGASASAGRKVAAKAAGPGRRPVSGVGKRP